MKPTSFESRYVNRGTTPETGIGFNFGSSKPCGDARMQRSTPLKKSPTLETGLRLPTAPRISHRPAAVGLIFLFSFGWFAATAENSGIASVFCDPVSRIASQDEAVYGREAIEMAAQGHYL